MAAMLMSSLFATTASAADKPVVPPSPATVEKVETTPALPTDQFIVKFKPAATKDSSERVKTYAKAESDTAIKVKEVKAAANDLHIVKSDRKLSAAEVQKVQKSIATAANVESVEPDTLMQPTSTPNDPYYSKQWNLSDPNVGIRVPSVWDKTTGVGQVVAVIDTGITSHSDLNANVIAGYDMISPTAASRDTSGRDADPSDPGNYKVAGDCGTSTTSNSSWHGTHVAGIIAALGNNGAGVTGAAPGVKIEPIRALGECGGYLSDVMDGVTWASGGTVPNAPANTNPAKTINLSLGGQATCSASFQAAIDGAVQRGSSVFVAAGNQNQPASNLTPANCNNVIVVGASNQAGDKASYSNYGSAVDIVAPGGDNGAGILSTYNTGTTTPGTETYAYMMGTSMATPTAAAVGALMKAADPSLTPAQIESKLKSTAHTLTGTCTGGCGAGLIDASAAVVFPASSTSNSTPSQTPIGVKAASLNGSLGTATTAEVYGLRNGGGYQCFQLGCIIWSPATGAHISMGAIRGLWAATGFENGSLGYPVSDEVSGLKDGGVYQNYERGAIIWSPATGAHISVGAIRGLWAETGFENGGLGYPVSDEVGGLRDGGVYQNYQGGAIIWSPATGAHISVGAIRGEWAATGFESGGLGYPVSNEVGGLRDGGVYQNYQGGAIIWSPASGAHASVGAIRSVWASTGFESGRLGYPTSDEYATGGGWVAQNYQGGVIHWSPTGSYIS